MRLLLARQLAQAVDVSEEDLQRIYALALALSDRPQPAPKATMQPAESLP